MANHDSSQGTSYTLLVGRIVASGTQLPLPGVTVVASERTEGDGRILRRAHTDAHGRFEVGLSDDDMRVLMSNAPTQPRLEATVYLRVWNGDESLGVVTAKLDTGPAPTWVDLGDRTVTMESAVRRYTLRAVVISRAAVPLPGVKVALEAVEIGTRTSLGTAITDDDGKVVFGYDGGPRASAADTDRRLQLVASVGGDEDRSPVLFSLRHEQVVRIVASRDPGAGRSELERLSAAIAEPLGAAELGTLALEDVEILAQQADVYPPHLAYWVRAAALAQPGLVGQDELYGMFRAGLPPTVAGLLAHDGEAYRRALSRAYEHKLIPIPAGGQAASIDTIAGRMAQWAGSLSVDPARTTPRWANLERSGVSEAQRRSFATRWIGLTGSPAERWAALADDPSLRGALPALQFVVGVSLVVGDHGPAVQALVDARANGDVKTLRDLAMWGPERWSAVLQGAGVPAVLDSGDASADTERLARIAMRVLDVLYPSAGMSRQLITAADPVLVRAGTFLRDRADFDLQRTVPARYHARHPEAFSAGQAGRDELAALARVQRVHALTPSIERPAVTQALLGLGLESAGMVVHEGLDGFVDKHAATLDGVHPFLTGSQLARAVFQQATVRHGAAMAMMAQLGKAFQGTPMTVWPTIEWVGDPVDPASATLRELFGSQDYCSCEHCRSVYGPAAYLVDLLALLQGRPAIAPETTALDVLKQRRPDLTRLQLSCANTNTEMPYIDLVLELLEERATHPLTPPAARQTTRTAAELRLEPEHRDDDAYDLTAAAVFPWGLPFDLPTERVRAYCAQLGASRLEAMRVLRRASEGPTAVMDRVAEALALSPSALQLVSGATAYGAPVTTAPVAWGMADGWVATLAGDVAQVLERSGLDFDGLRARLALELVNPGQVAQVVFDEPSCDLADARIDAIDEPILDRLQRFVRLERATGLPPIVLDRALRGLGGALDAAALQRLADARPLASRLQRSLVELLVLWRDLDTEDHAGDPSPYARLFRSRVLTPQLDPAFRLNGTGTELAGGQDGPADLTEARHPTIRAALTLSDADLRLLVAETLPASPLLSLATLSALTRHAVLARALQVPVAELLTLLALVDADPFASPEQAARFVEGVESLRAAGLELSKLDYLARHRFSPTAGLDPSDDAIGAFLDALRAAVQAIDPELLAEAIEPEDLPEALEDALTQLRDEALVQGLAAALDLPPDATRLLAFELVHQGVAPARAALLDVAFLAGGDPQDAQRQAYRRLHKAAMVVKALAVPTADLPWYFGGAPADRLLDLDALPLAEGGDPRPHVRGLRRVALGRALQEELGPTGEVWAEVVGLGPAPDFAQAAAAALAAHSTWDAADLEHAMTEVLELADAGELRDPFTVARLRDAAMLARRTGLRAAQLDALVRPRATAAIADALQAALKARYDDATWPQVITPIADRLRGAQRDALVGYLVGRGDFPDATALYDHFLVDPLMGPCMLTSRLRLALSAVQMFIQRVLMNLEQDDVTFPPATAERWAWMKSYRVWEANRKVFFYPENWIEPELRDDKTPFFRELEQHLQQGELTDEHVEAGYRQYLRRLHEVAHLEVPALFREWKDGHQIVHVLGRTRGLPPKYWYRTRVDDAVWTPWVEVPVDIPSNAVTLAAHNRRLFVLWAEAQEETEEPESRYDDPASYLRVRIGWTELRDGSWAPKKVTTLSSGKTGLADDVRPDQLRIVAYEHSGALSVDVVYPGQTGRYLHRCASFRYDSCRDVLDEKNAVAFNSYHYMDLGCPSNMTFDGQRHRGEGDGRLHLIHHTELGQSRYLSTSLLFNLPHTSWLTTAMQARFYEGDTPVVFDDPDHAFYIVPERAMVPPLRGSSVPRSSGVDPWSMLGGVVSETLPDPAPVPPSKPLISGAAPWGGKVPGLAKVQLHQAAESISGGVIASPKVSASPARAAFLAMAGEGPMPAGDAHGVAATTRSILQTTLESDVLSGPPPAPPGITELVEGWAYRIDPFHHPYTCMLLANLSRYGLPGVLAPAPDSPLRRQLADEGVVVASSDDPDPARDYRPHEAYVVPPFPHDDFDFTPEGAYSVYNWELFVHAPLLIAERLRRDRRFEQAQRWYHFIFNPLQGIEPEVPVGPARFWNAKPLYDQASGGPIDIIKAVMSDDGLTADPELTTDFFDSIWAWVADPFSPHAIARWRAGTYQKAIVRKYLDNLIEWGDSLFRQDTMESINEATQIYLLAASILGPRPQRLPAMDAPVRTYDDLGHTWLFGGLTELESFVPPVATELPELGLAMVALGGLEEAGSGPAEETPPALPVWWAFCLPANDQLLAYWDRVGDRLFKIRNCMNIDGVRRALRLFEPPIDPALLVRAKALGVDLGSALADLQAPRSQFRFAVLRARAHELLGDVRALGGALLSALEKRDAEALGLLRATHEVALLRANRAARTLQIEEAEQQLAVLARQKQTVQARQAYYASREKMNEQETAALALSRKAKNLQMASQIAGALAGLLHLIPQLDAGVLGFVPMLKLIFGGENIGPAARAAGDVLGILAGVAQNSAQMTATLAGYERRHDDWVFQAQQAEAELKQLDAQGVAAEIRVAMAKHELSQHDRQVAHSEEVEAFLRTKFTNDELYDWMVGQLSALYFQSYKLAHDMARRAQRALQRELGRSDLHFIEPQYWDGLRKGLLAGERLALDLRRMEVAQLDHDRRELELTKRVSLRLLNPAELHNLRETGECDFDVPEVAFDLDHPGQYFRRIKSVSLSIPAVAGPHVSAGATLTLLDHETRIESSPQSPYGRTGQDDARFQDPEGMPIQSMIATSRGRDDAGVFELSFRDEKYMPFEGAGAISTWRIELPSVRQFDYRTISDVELELRYTARDGGADLRTAASDAVRTAIQTLIAAGNPGGFFLLLSATKDFATEWERLLRPAEGQEGEPLAIPIVTERFPYVLRERGIVVDAVRMVFVGDPAALSLAGTELTIPVPSSQPFGVSFTDALDLLEATVPPVPPQPPAPAPPALPVSFPVALSNTTGPWSLALPAGAVVDPDRVEDLWVLVRYHVTTP